MLIPLSGCLCKRSSRGIPDEGYIDLRLRHVHAHLHAFRSLHRPVDVSMEGWTDGPRGMDMDTHTLSVSSTFPHTKTEKSKLSRLKRHRVRLRNTFLYKKEKHNVVSSLQIFPGEHVLSTAFLIP